MLWLILVHFGAACCAAPLVWRWGPRAFLALALVPGSAAVWAGVRWTDVTAGHPPTAWWGWIPRFGVGLALRCDALALLMVLIAGGVGALVLVYCAGYFGADERRLGAFAGTLTAFAGAMLGLVLADDLILLYVMWELTTVFSFLLVGHLSERRTNRRAALQALLVTTLGGLAMLVGFLMLGHAAGTYRVSHLVADPPPAGPLLSAALVLVLAGAVTKSAVWPFSFWLPGAMAAPTPVSAYLHAAAMVKAGVYLVARLAPAFAHVVPWRAAVLVLGGATMLLGGWRALRETDLKRLLAFGTVSQLGFLTLLVGDGTRSAALAGAAMILAHALFKAPLFLVVGVVDHATGTRDLRELSGVGRAMPWVGAVAVLAGLSMAGLPPLLGFAAKEAAVQALAEGDAAGAWALAAVVAGSALTTAYTLRFLWGVLLRKPRLPDTPLIHRPGAALCVPPALCAATALLLGPGASRLDPLLSQYAHTVPAHGAEPVHLALWHGFGLPLGLSALAWAAGALLFLAGRPAARLGAWLARLDGDRVFARTLWSLEWLSLQVTGVVQRGSLRVYLGTALVVLVGCEGAALAVDRPWRQLTEPRWFDSVPQLAVGVGVCAVALLCVAAGERLKAAVLVGVTGYGTGVLYVLHGAPDLALTQFAVETVSLIVFVLVLRRLPVRFPDGRRGLRVRRATQLVFALAAGGLVAGLTYLAAAARPAPPTAGQALGSATAHEGVKNVVATTLVDLRAWDTMGESAVLGVAAIGVTSLVYLRRRARAGVALPQRPARTPAAPTTGSPRGPDRGSRYPAADAGHSGESVPAGGAGPRGGSLSRRDAWKMFGRPLPVPPRGAASPVARGHGE
ncbi:Na+/H+ antiporter subunit A, partial [Streptomyces boncukensis]|nr:Na+/H+ antiporter subunit A [Streptomyces boncukensis]